MLSMDPVEHDSSIKPEGPVFVVDKRRDRRHSLWFFVLIALVVIPLFIRNCSPFSRLAPRSFIMQRDYRDMKNIFRQDPLPSSFKIKDLQYPGVTFPGPDGPPPVLYHAAVSGADYPLLVANIEAEKIAFDTGYGRVSAVYPYDTELLDQVSLFDEGLGELNKLPDMYEVTTTSTAGYASTTNIVADTRSSDSVELYMSTRYPYSQYKGW